MGRPKQVMELTDKDIRKSLAKKWEGMKFKIRRIIRDEKARCILVFYKVTCEKQGTTEYRVWGVGKSSGWDYATRIKF